MYSRISEGSTAQLMSSGPRTPGRTTHVCTDLTVNGRRVSLHYNAESEGPVGGLRWLQNELHSGSY